VNRLVITTALATVLALSASGEGLVKVNKGPFELKLNAELNVQAGTKTQSNRDGKSITQNNDDVALDSAARIALGVQSKTERGTVYGANIGLTPHVRFYTNSAQRSFDKTYIFVEEQKMGRVEIGSNIGAGEMMYLSAGSIAAGTGGVNGDWANYFSFPKEYNPGDFLINPALPIDNTLIFMPYVAKKGGHSPVYYNSNAYSEKSRKITYLSPVFGGGWQAGISYIPDAGNIGVFPTLPYQKKFVGNRESNAVSGGVQWVRRDPGTNRTVKLSVFGEYGKVKRSYGLTNNGTGDGVVQGPEIPVHNTKAIGIGGTVDSGKYLAAASFTWLGKSGYVKNPLDGDNGNQTSMKNAWHATAGVGMRHDKIYSSLTAAYSTINSNRTLALSGGLNYEAAPGFLPYAEVTYVNLKGKNTGGISVPLQAEVGDIPKDTTATTATVRKRNASNRGLVFILGTRVKF
jgi:hypothetical protein